MLLEEPLFGPNCIEEAFEEVCVQYQHGCEFPPHNQGDVYEEMAKPVWQLNGSLHDEIVIVCGDIIRGGPLLIRSFIVRPTPSERTNISLDPVSTIAKVLQRFIRCGSM